jgi:hypothetical protein
MGCTLSVDASTGLSEREYGHLSESACLSTIMDELLPFHKGMSRDRYGGRLPSRGKVASCSSVTMVSSIS